MIKKCNLLVTICVAAVVLVGLCGCKESESGTAETVIDGVTYSLSSDWQIDNKEKTMVMKMK